MGRQGRALILNTWQGDVGTELVTGFETGAVLVGIFRRVGAACQIFHKIQSRAWQVLQSMQKRCSLARGQNL